ncbi:putative transcription factor B3-Domain family [Lupinus albus]|uniref:Putative transcription factor B3-Domain family n=1 Tax=Lupinus albus TaxID=3870 RepID=A0A6A4QXU4_LUPAL|nr:putative transcription factor B3-Domain family [Lupinus albus]
MWLNNDDQDDDLLGVNDPSMFYADFPSLPDFPCMSSSSSSSPTHVLPLKTTTCTTTTTSSSSSTSAASRSFLKSGQPSVRDSHHQLMGSGEAVLKSDFEEKFEQNNYNCYIQHQNHQQQHDFDDIGTATLSSTASMEVSQQHHYQEHQNHDPGLDGTSVGDCMDEVMGFGYMELFEGNEFFDAASILQSEENPLGLFTQDQMVPVPQQEEHQHQHQLQHAMVPQHHHNHHYQEPTPLQHQGMINEEENRHNQALLCPPTTTNDNEEVIQGEGGATGAGLDDEMSNVFLEWLKSNKDSVSANDLRSVKLKKATIESAARRLGGGKEAMKQLLKLILEWVQTSHLQNKRPKESNNNSDPLTHFQGPIQSQNRNNTSSNLKNAPDQSNTCFNQTPWVSVSEPNYGTTTDQAPLMATPKPFPQQMVGAASNNHNPYQPGAEFQMLDSTPSWPPSQFTTVANFQYNQSFGDNNLHTQKPSAVTATDGYGNQYPYLYFHHSPGGDRLMRLGPSATREARKKRMARQRRILSHHKHGHNENNRLLDSHARLGSDNCTAMLAPAHANQANWMYWQTMSGGAAPMAQVVPAEPPAAQQVVDWTAMQTQNTQNYHEGRVSSEKRQQGWKSEKNLKFLLQKVLKQSDVGSLGRIVLPKKEAETHLPGLEARDGISITMEDISTSRVWNMRYRYWPNNKSRMYLLENTGDFVRANGLQEGDFIVIYSDVKCGKFMIRGVKVRQQGTKPETKKALKSQKNQHGCNAATIAGAVINNNNVTPSSPKQKNEKLVK